MIATLNAVLKEVGLDRWPPFVMDKKFWLAIAGGFPVWFLIWLTVAPMYSMQDRSIINIALASIIYYPLLEEILFRGVIQGQLSNLTWGRNKILLLSIANWITSLLFVVAHIIYQPMVWAIMVIIPSLIYGYFRDRYFNIIPGIVLHAYYNSGFVIINFIAQ